VFRKRAKLAYEKGVLFCCLRLEEIDWEDNQVAAYCLNGAGNRWVKRIIPVPQVIYDRGSSPTRGTVESFSHKGSVQSVRWLNTTRTFSKWETYRALLARKETNTFMPHTALCSHQTLETFLGLHKYCFIKHNYGRRGNAVFRVEKSGGELLCKTGGSKVKSWRFFDSASLLSFLDVQEESDWIVQQGIRLGKIGSSPFDLRILVQKDKYRNWVVSAVNERIAAPGAIITNFSAGARDEFVSPGQKMPHLDLAWKRLERFSLTAVFALEEHFGPIGEVGLDIALDENRRLWVIEANSRPSSKAYRNAPTEDRRRIFGLPLDYTIALRRKEELYAHLQDILLGPSHLLPE